MRNQASGLVLNVYQILKSLCFKNFLSSLLFLGDSKNEPFANFFLCHYLFTLRKTKNDEVPSANGDGDLFS